ncbi:hypothetical protein [Paracoccus sp. (in: a-proteobacteria)]|uniref:hypothetical protein n=1 Tax=Paracoccus sp. TaxID=267 RepID=UPI0026DEF37B|nr:hypothetical protein [Paracoccus sp. (in: a-proteobacteria)]MDO5646306.1 hypothetical protein [Paracoccus sp. (in: a-proteobacteria)]
MPKLISVTQIIMPAGKDGAVTVIGKNEVFDATVAQAKHFDALGAARPATEDEIKRAGEKADVANGLSDAPSIEEQIIVQPDSGAPGDPQSKPKGAKD